MILIPIKPKYDQDTFRYKPYGESDCAYAYGLIDGLDGRLTSPSQWH